jgi:hypothetical protein
VHSADNIDFILDQGNAKSIPFGSRVLAFVDTSLSGQLVVYSIGPPKHGGVLQLIFSMDPKSEMELSGN